MACSTINSEAIGRLTSGLLTLTGMHTLQLCTVDGGSMGVNWMALPQGKGRFVGPARGVDDKGHDLLEVQLPGLSSFYGEYRAVRDVNENFDVEILNFGFGSQSNVGNRNPGARRAFSDDESNTVETIIVALCHDEEAQRGIAMFSSSKARFLGRVRFASDWIVLGVTLNRALT